jgi:hypothetical protein
MKYFLIKFVNSIWMFPFMLFGFLFMYLSFLIDDKAKSIKIEKTY